MQDATTDALLEDILDEVEGVETTMPGPTVAALFEKRGRDQAPGSPGRAAWLSHAGERWDLAHEPERARACFEEAVRDGGPAWVDPRASLVGVLLDLGETARADSVLDELRQDLSRRRLRGPVHEFVGESLEIHDRLEEALRWFNAGLTLAAREDPDAVDLGCLNGRWRVRRRLGLPHDRYDAVSEEERRALRRDSESRRAERNATPADREPPTQLCVLHWPAAQYSLLLQRWPQLAESHGADHAEHTAVVERRLRELAGQGLKLSVADADVADYLSFAEREDKDPTESATRAAYGAHLGFLRRTRPWPPGRNGPCWCGSGRKYKKCCGGLRMLPGTGGYEQGPTAKEVPAMSESSNQPYGGRYQRPDDDTLPGERPVSEDERHVEPPGKRDDETASRAAEEGEMASQGGAVDPDPGIPQRVEPPSPADATEGDPPGGSVANQSGRTPDRSPSVPSEHGKRRS